MLVTLEEIKSQLRLEPDYADEDSYLTLIGKAAESRTSTYLNRKIYPSGEAGPENDPEGIVMSDDMRLAILFLITHFYENRSTVSEVDMAEMPLSFKWLVGPYRFYPQ